MSHTALYMQHVYVRPSHTDIHACTCSSRDRGQGVLQDFEVGGGGIRWLCACIGNGGQILNWVCGFVFFYVHESVKHVCS